MEENGFKKDLTPYLVFPCSKCHQFSYVKTTQKTKKCLRCNRNHQVKLILDKGEIVSGMTAAVNKVKEKQNQLSKDKPSLKSESEFSITKDFPINEDKKRIYYDNEEDNYEEKFNSLLKEIRSLYKKFPRYVINTLAVNYQIPASVINNLLRKYVKNKTLTVLKNDYFSFT